MSRPTVLLVGILVQGRDPASLDASLDELARLCDTLGMDVVGRLIQRRNGLGASVILGEGKLRELAAWTGGPGVVHRGPQKTKAKAADDEDDDDDGGAVADDGADDDPAAVVPSGVRATIVAVDHELSPSQLRNLKSAAGCEVLDRTGVIIEIFSQRARTREARLQVELARLQYLAPRLRELGGPSERQRGGIGGKGAGETALELDRRKIRDRLAEIRRELVELEGTSGVRRARRRDVRQVALVGYTNAGKSSLLRALTGAEPYVADQLFATLDTTVRKLHPEVVPSVLVTDTVGFIKDLPHSLVVSFRSTLDAALEASLLLHVVDANDPSWREQEAVTAKVLEDIGAGGVARVLVFNKCDRVSPAAVAALADERPFAWFTSAKDPGQTRALRDRIVAFFSDQDLVFELFVPWARSGLVGAIRAQATVLGEGYEDEGVRYQLRAPAAVADDLRRSLGVDGGEPASGSQTQLGVADDEE